MMTTAATRASGTNSAVGFNEPEQIVPQNQLDAQNPFSMSTMYGHTRPFTHAHGVSPYASASAMPGIPSSQFGMLNSGSGGGGCGGGSGMAVMSVMVAVAAAG